MIVVKVELWPMGHESRKQELSRLWIANVGGTRTKGNYKAALTRKGTTKPPWPHGDGGQELAKPVRTCEIEGHPRLALHVFTLVAKCVIKLFPDGDET